MAEALNNSAGRRHPEAGIKASDGIEARDARLAMNARRTDWQDLLFGLFLIAVAAIALTATRTLSGGNAADMGPGYMPRAIAINAAGVRALVWHTRAPSAVHRDSAGAAAAAARDHGLVAVFALTATRFGLALSSFARS